MEGLAIVKCQLHKIRYIVSSLFTGHSMEALMQPSFQRIIGKHLKNKGKKHQSLELFCCKLFFMLSHLVGTTPRKIE